MKMNLMIKTKMMMIWMRKINMDAKKAFEIWTSWQETVRSIKSKKERKKMIDKALEDPEILEANKFLLTHHICGRCGKKMTKQMDTITGKISDHIWGCECCPDVRLMML